MKKRVAALEAEVSDVKAINRRMVATLARLEGKVDDLGGRLSDRLDGLVTRQEFNGRMDQMMTAVEDSRFRWAIHATILAEHEKRLTKLEARRA